MSDSNRSKHLSLEERKIIENGIRNGATKRAIASTVGKDPSTIAKEIRLHRVLKHRSRFNVPCVFFARCHRGKPKAFDCSSSCPQFIPFQCTRRDRSPGACNGCSKYSSCPYDKFYYLADTAQQEYKDMLVDSRLGFDLTTQEAIALAKCLKPLLKQGQSIYQICTHHPEIRQSEKTIYTYIENGVFDNCGEDSISLFDLRSKVNRRPARKKKCVCKKREDRKFLQGRSYLDYQTFIEELSIDDIVQMDTVYNDISTGPFIQTFKFIKYHFFFALYHQNLSAVSMVRGVDLLEQILGHDLFRSLVRVILTDRGSEFSAADAMEHSSDGSCRTHIFYCDPMRSNQKGSLENNHIELRYILPSGSDMRALGLHGQKELNLVLSHINSMAKEKLEGKSSFELSGFLNPTLVEKFQAFGLTIIDKDKVILKPYLLKK